MTASASRYSPSPMWEADEREREELLKAVVDLGRRTLRVTAENEGSAEVPPPVRVRPEPRLILGDRVLEPSRRREAEGLLELPVRLLEVAADLVQEPEVSETLRQNPLVACLPRDREGRFGAVSCPG